MFGPTGVVAYIVTVHPGILSAAAVGAALCTVALVLLLTAAGAKHRVVLALCFFVGATLTGHFLLSRLADVQPVQVDTVSIGGDDLRPAEGARPSPPPLK